MASLPTLIPLAADVDHVAAYKALISRRSQRGRQLHDYFDQIVAGFQARDDFLMAHITSLSKTLYDHGIPIPTPESLAASSQEDMSVGQHENRSAGPEDGEPSSYTTDSENSGKHARVNRKRSSSGSLPCAKRPELSRLSQSAEESGSSSSLSSVSAMPPRANHCMRKWSSARVSKKRGHASRVHPNDSSSPDHVSELSELPSSEARTSPLKSAADVASEGSLRIKREATEDEHGEMSKNNDSQPTDDESVIHGQNELEVFEDPLLALSPTPTISGGDETSLSGGSEFEKPESLDPQHAVGGSRSDDSGEWLSGASSGPSYNNEWIDPTLLQTFYGPGSDCAPLSRYDADYEASDEDEEHGTDAGDTEVHETEPNDSDVATEVIVKAEPEESLCGSLSPSEEVRFKVEKEEFLGGSLSPSEIARIAPAHRKDTNVFVRGWAQGVARATVATEPDAGPVLGGRSESSLAGTLYASQDMSSTIKKEKGSPIRKRKGGR